MGVLGGVAKGAGAFAGVVVLLHVAVLVGLKLYMVDHDWDCYDPEEAGSFCEFYGCPAVPEYEHTGEFLRTFERVRRNLRISFKDNASPLMAHKELQWIQFFEHPEWYTLTESDLWPSVNGVDLEPPEGETFLQGLWKGLKGEIPLDRISLLALVTRTGPPPLAPDFIHHHFLGAIDRAPSFDVEDHRGFIYHLIRGPGLRFVMNSPLYGRKKKLEKVRALERAAADGAARPVDAEAAKMFLAHHAIFDNQNEFAIPLLEEICEKSLLRPGRTCRDPAATTMAETLLRRLIVLAEVRRGEFDNCALQHTGESCVMPLAGHGVHVEPSGAKAAAKWLTLELEVFDAGSQASKWMLNVVHMQLGTWPGGVREAWRLPASAFDSDYDVGKFPNVAKALGLDFYGITGSVAADDFSHDDGTLEHVAGGMLQWPGGRLSSQFKAQANGTFVDASLASSIKQVGSVHLFKQADYDNDGDLDLFAARGGWAPFLQLPNSLLRNDAKPGGAAKFTEVSYSAGTVTYQGTHTAEWADFDLDGHLDIYVGNEQNPCALHRNNGDGTFTNVAQAMGVETCGWVKGVAWGDIDGDNYPDLFVSTMSGPNYLYHNQKGTGFLEVAGAKGVRDHPRLGFPVGFMDFDNDGCEDVLVAAHRSPDPGETFAFYSGEPWREEAIVERRVGEHSRHNRLYRNKCDGTGRFDDISLTTPGVGKTIGAMSMNFGDIDNDGFLDVYTGTSMPDLRALQPNSMLRNDGGKGFQDVTFSGGFGHLQKGHGIAFADVNNDGHVDVSISLGGGVVGDKMFDALFLNPGTFFHNSWLKLSLVGVKSNKLGQGARLKVTTADGRNIYMTQGLTASFGSNPVKIQHIGLGDIGPDGVVDVEIAWPIAGAAPQTVRGVRANSWVTVTEGSSELRYRDLEVTHYDTDKLLADELEMGCSMH